MTDLKKFSVLDSRFEKFEDRRGDWIRKETRLHPKLGPYYKELQKLVGQYVNDLQEAQIPLPKVLQSESDETKLLFVCEYKGLNILEFIGEGGLGTLLNKSHSSLLDKILEILRQAQRGGINFDPHIKNFVVDSKGEVSYVDFTPPWLQGYYDIRLSVATEEEREILTAFYRCMAPENLGYHFCSDFVKMDESNRVFMPKLHKFLKEKGLVCSHQESFLRRCEEIKTAELKREREGIYLL